MSDLPSLDLNETLSNLQPAPSKDVQKSIQSLLKDPNRRVPIFVALDDDPTGTQTCHDVHVLTVWDKDTLVNEFRNTPHGGGFFILTNSRALHPPQARILMSRVCENLKEAAKEAGVVFEITSRSDSTLRGHFPLELIAAEEALGLSDAWILCPFFLQGGRYTIDDVHYVSEGGKLVPAADTQFAKDATFGYTNSNLKDWVVEKSKGFISKNRVQSVSIETIRQGGVEAVKKELTKAIRGAVVIINAAATEDIDVVILAILELAETGKKLLYRTGAAFVSSRLGIEQIPPITAEQLSLSGSVGGLITAGSYVPKTTSQLEVLRDKCGEKLTAIVLDVPKLLASEQSDKDEISQAVSLAEKEISRGQDVLVMTSRELITGDDEAKSLDIGSTVAEALVSFLTNLKTKPRYIIAKVSFLHCCCKSK